LLWSSAFCEAVDAVARHQQHPLSTVVDVAAPAAIGQRLEEADQIICGSGVLSE